MISSKSLSPDLITKSPTNYEAYATAVILLSVEHYA